MGKTETKSEIKRRRAKEINKKKVEKKEDSCGRGGRGGRRGGEGGAEKE